MFAMRNIGYAISVQKEDFREEEAIHIVYVMCGEERSDEFMASLKSLHLFAKVALQADQNYFHIHVITADTVSFSFMHHPCISPCLPVCTHLPDSFCCFTAAALQLLLKPYNFPVYMRCVIMSIFRGMHPCRMAQRRLVDCSHEAISGLHSTEWSWRLQSSLVPVRCRPCIYMNRQSLMT